MAGVGGVGGYKGGSQNGPQFNSFLQGMRAKHAKLQDTDPLLIRKIGCSYLSLRDVQNMHTPAVRRIEIKPHREIIIIQDPLHKSFLIEKDDNGHAHRIYIPNTPFSAELKKDIPVVINTSFAVTYEGRDHVRYQGIDIIKIESLDMDGIQLLIELNMDTLIDPKEYETLIANGSYVLQNILNSDKWKKCTMDTKIRRDDDPDRYATAHIFPVKLSLSGNVIGLPSLYPDKEDYFQFYVAVLATGGCKILNFLDNTTGFLSMEPDVPLPLSIIDILAGIENRLSILPRRWNK